MTETGTPVRVGLVGAELRAATELANAVRANGVPTLLALTRRYDAGARAFLESATDSRAAGLVAVSAAFAHGGLLPGGFIGERERNGWRSAMGVLADLHH